MSARLPRPMPVLALALGLAASACGDADPASDTTPGTTPDTTPEDTAHDTRAATAETIDADGADAPDATDAPDTPDTPDTMEPPLLPADTYCERIVESFCAYYVRCGRMAVPDVAACRPAFLETCNARYEPLWSALADRGVLALSRDGLAACDAHLADVACERQIFDLDGGCAHVWQGLVPADGACGPGLETFVCTPDTTCVLGLDFCGHCVPRAAPGATCDLEHRCDPTEVCVDGACRARRQPGETCDEAVGCVLGASCRDGTCQGDVIVGIGDACDLDHACPYKSACVSGRCRETMLVDEACGGETGCASGICGPSGTCVALVGEGAACTRPDACTSGRCTGSVCEAPAFGCIDEAP